MTLPGWHAASSSSDERLELVPDDESAQEWVEIAHAPRSSAWSRRLPSDEELRAFMPRGAGDVFDFYLVARTIAGIDGRFAHSMLLGRADIVATDVETFAFLHEGHTVVCSRFASCAGGLPRTTPLHSLLAALHLARAR